MLWACIYVCYIGTMISIILKFSEKRMNPSGVFWYTLIAHACTSWYKEDATLTPNNVDSFVGYTLLHMSILTFIVVKTKVHGG